MKPEGVWIPLVTPFANAEIDYYYRIRLANADDLEGLWEVLTGNGLKPTIAIGSASLFYLAEASGIIGSAGAEICGDAALIRSTAVLPPYREKGIAKKLVETLILDLEKKGIRRLYLLSRRIGDFWKGLGFVSCPYRK
jgi:amino-acid N-acetyltransferase